MGAGMDVGVAEWLDGLPPELERQAALLRRLLDGVRADPRWRVLELQCSVARGAGDEDSDLDAGLWVADDAWPAALDDLDRLLVGGLGPVVDALRHRIAAWGDLPHQRWFVQYTDGTQLDLVVRPVGGILGRVPDAVVLYDPDGYLAHDYQPVVMRATAADVREWALLGWSALADVAKYLRRRSVWEALDRLNEARGHALRLWAVDQGVPYPVFGLTSLLDEPDATLPEGLAATAARPEWGELHRAAVACGELLGEASGRARTALGVAEGTPMAAFVMRRLEALGQRTLPRKPRL
jgi:hypothetical protein